MIDKPSRKSIGAGRLPGLAVALSAAISLGACAQNGGTSDLLSLADGGSQTKAAPSNDPVQAVAHYSRLYAANPKDKSIALNYADALGKTGQKSRALSVLRTSAAHHRGDREFTSAFGRAALAANQVGLATKLLHKADDPANPDWRIVSGLGTALAKQGKYEEAVGYYDRALKLAPSNPSVMSNLAMARAASGDLQTAERLLRQATQMPMAKQKVHRNLALVLKLQGREAEAKKAEAAALPEIRSSVNPAAPAATNGSSRVAQARTTR